MDEQRGEDEKSKKADFKRKYDCKHLPLMMRNNNIT